MSIDFNKLRAPFSPDEIEWRVGSTTQDKKKGMALAYIDARAVMDRLDAVCSPAGWQCRYTHTTGKTVCEVGVKVGDEWVWKADGAGDTDVEAEKGALSDALKRAAVRWGIGRYLYDLDSPWVELEPMGRSFRIKPTELPKLKALLQRNAQGSQAAAPANRPVPTAPRSQPPQQPATAPEPANGKRALDWPSAQAKMDGNLSKFRAYYDECLNALVQPDEVNKLAVANRDALATLKAHSEDKYDDLMLAASKREGELQVNIMAAG